MLSRVTGLSEEQLHDQRSVDIDSLVGVELRVLLQNTLGCRSRRCGCCGT
ncbi:hypothetical protein NKH77_44710 [Streptomyces sp. M19]